MKISDRIGTHLTTLSTAMSHCWMPCGWIWHDLWYTLWYGCPIYPQKSFRNNLLAVLSMRTSWLTFPSYIHCTSAQLLFSSMFNASNKQLRLWEIADYWLTETSFRLFQTSTCFHSNFNWLPYFHLHFKSVSANWFCVVLWVYILCAFLHRDGRYYWSCMWRGGCFNFEGDLEGDEAFQK